MKLKKDISFKKERGGYYTPLNLSSFIVNLLNKDNLKILEPSCGDGAFLESIIDSKKKNNKVDAIEIIKEEYEKAKHLCSKKTFINIVNDDFYNFYKSTNEKYDLIVGNPPYIRYQYLTEKQRKRQSDVLLENNMVPNKLINSWVFFLVACVNLLNDNGKIGFVIPAELLQVVYAEDLRAFLKRELNKITIISFDNLVFDDAEQEVIVLIGEKEKEKNKCEISNCSFKDINDLIKNFDENKLEYSNLVDERNKWTNYYLSDKQNDLINKIKSDDRFQKFEDIALINVGITTGNNDYFSVDKKTVDEYDLESVALPLIGRSSQAHGLFFDKNDWQFNINKGVKAFLLNFDESIDFNELPTKQQKYIKYGEKIGANKGYKCKIRNKWYCIPSIWVPDAFFLRRSNNYPKFVINKINAVSTDTMHRINFYEGVDKNIVTLSYYNSITFAFVELNGRSYGGGVLEVLPKEVSNILLPKIEKMDKNKVENLLKTIDEKIRNKNDIEELLDIMDQELLINILKIDKKIVNEFRNIWKFMVNRRHNRGKRDN